MNYLGHKIIDGIKYLNKINDYKAECKLLGKYMHEYGFICIKTPYYDKQIHSKFTSVMEKYFESRSAMYRNHKFCEELDNSINYQRGLTPENKLVQLRSFPEFRSSLLPEDQPISSPETEADKAWRYFQKIDEPNTVSPKYLPPNFVVSDIPELNPICQEWGTRLLKTARLVSEMLAVGFDLKPDTFTSKMDGAEHLIAPTGTNLSEYKEGTAVSKLHYDLNYLTIHGPSSLPGLYIWLHGEKPKRKAVLAPDGTFLVQNGKQMEILTGGYLKAGFHEVINSKEALEASKEKVRNGRSGFRVASILFAQLNHDLMLDPIEVFKTLGNSHEEYKPILVKDQILQELEEFVHL